MNGINLTINYGIKSSMKKPNEHLTNKPRGERRISFSDEKGKQLEQILYYTKVETETVRSASCVIA